MRTLTDGEREILDELREWDAEESEGVELSGVWCHGCDNPVEECRCRPIAAPAPGRTPLERAVNRAMEHGIAPCRLDEYTYAVPSATTPGESYAVCRHEGPGGTPCWTCTCPAGQRGVLCWHIGSVVMDVAGRKAPTPTPAPVYAEAGAVALWA